MATARAIIEKQYKRTARLNRAEGEMHAILTLGISGRRPIRQLPNMNDQSSGQNQPLENVQTPTVRVRLSRLSEESIQAALTGNLERIHPQRPPKKPENIAKSCRYDLRRKK